MQPAWMIPASDPARKIPPLRFLTATSIFDGHDAAINVIRRILQTQGAEVIHLGHNRSVAEIVTAAIQEDVQGIAVSSYQGGHTEFYKYLIDQLREKDATTIKVFGGGGGVILPDEIHALQHYGVNHIYSPEDGRRMGLQGMISDMIKRCSVKSDTGKCSTENSVLSKQANFARLLSHIETDRLSARMQRNLLNLAQRRKNQVPVLGVTGTGGAGKSSLLDELIRRFRSDYGDTIKIALFALDPTRKKSNGALLGDRIRMNAIHSPGIFMRSVATRDSITEIPDHLSTMIAAGIAHDFDLIIVETPGIGQGSAGITRITDRSLYVMTPEFGADTQLEKVDMLDFAELIAINKFDQNAGLDALRRVRKQVQRNREAFSIPLDELPVFGTIASRPNDPGIDNLYCKLLKLLIDCGLRAAGKPATIRAIDTVAPKVSVIPPSRTHYLSKIAETIRAYHRQVESQSEIASELQSLKSTRTRLTDCDNQALDALIESSQSRLNPTSKKLLDEWPELKCLHSGKTVDEAKAGNNPTSEYSKPSHSGMPIPKIALPNYRGHGDLLHWRMLENLPGFFPFTAGVFELKRDDEAPTRMFAGEGSPERTNKRFKLLSQASTAKRLSTAFDSVTLYGFDPDRRPDIFGRIGNSGVSISTLEDMKILYDGFDLCAPNTSVSMTINGPAATLLAMYFNTAIDQQVIRFETEHSRSPSLEEYQEIKKTTLNIIRGTVQADILKEDQSQNTCIFSTDFSLKIMGDVQEYFIDNNIRHFYSASISGYHIAEAGANPITQLAFTLANGFTYVETYLARGMPIDDFAKNLSFFFSNGMDPEYTVIGRVARRIWAIAMRDHYGANKRSQKLKYHVQTSGRSLHAQGVEFNDIRTSLQALNALQDNCNSLHTNASDEAVTTPTEQSVRKALAIQEIINREWGLSLNQNPNQGSFINEALTHSVEAAVLEEFDQLSSRGGVLGAMETGYQRSRIQEESLRYETGKHDGKLPIVGVNTFQNQNNKAAPHLNVSRSTPEERLKQIKRLRDFKRNHEHKAPKALQDLKLAAMNNANSFAVLMETVKVCSLGQITQALFEVGGEYRRNM